MATYLVTGGAGFIGSHIVEELVKRGETVRVLDNLSTGNEGNLAAVKDRITFHRLDIRDLESIRPAFRGVDYVIHEAAMVSVAASIEDPVTSNAVNHGGTLHVLVAARDAGVKRLVFAGSAAVYGNVTALPQAEDQTAHPLSPYGLHKLAGEHHCQLFTSLYGFEAVTLRYFNVFGPRQNPDSPYAGVLSLFISAYLRGGTPKVFGDGEQSRDFVYVSNVVDATLGACMAPNAGGQVMNVGMGSDRTLNETIRILNSLFEREVRPSYEPARPGDARHSRADITLAKCVLGYEPRVSFEEGLRKTIEWYRANLH
jgi:nucleoside-diphosphate-sugar epimerase